MEKKYYIHHLDCASCAQKVEDFLNKQTNIHHCTISFANGVLFIEADETLTLESLENMIKEVEPEATLSEKKQVSHHEHHHEEECCCGHHHEEECCCGHHHEEECCCGHHHKHHDEKHTLNEKGTLTFIIKGLDCASCAMKVENAIQKMDIVDKVVLNFSTEKLQVKPQQFLDENLLMNEIQKVINQIEEGVTISLNQTKKLIGKPRLFVWQDNVNLIAGSIVYIASLLMQENQMAFLGFLIAYILIGLEVILKAVKNIGRGEVFDENFLMAIATIGAFSIGDYPEAVAVMLFYSIGEIFQSYAVNKTRSSISSLMDIKSEYAHLKTEHGIQQVSPETVQVGDLIVVKVGEKVPLDGIVVKGRSLLDTSSLTGESVPREVCENDSVLAGVVNLNEILEIKVTTPYVDCTVSKILELIENAASKKAPIEKFITRFAKVYTPTVVGLAVLLAIVPMFIFENAIFTDWLYRALTFLVVSCPCVLVISIPLGLYAGLGKASKVGALIKGGNYLELLKDVDTIVFDKTGTLTMGNFDVVEINGNDDLLMYGAYGEYYSNHPIAKSIVHKYNETIYEEDIHDFKETAGKGIDVYIKGKHVLLGNASFMNSHNISFHEPKEVGTIVYIAIEGKFAGSIVVADQIKESTKDGIQALKDIGIKNTIMLTGDHHLVAQHVAEQLGIDTVYSELLPQDKVTQVENLLNQEGYVAFVGDGINDAPVLARADVGIAMGDVGSDAAIEAADIVLMQDNIETIRDAIVISQKTNRILKENVIFTLFIKIGVLILTMFGFGNMWMGVFADVGVTLIAIFNSMRVLK